MTDSTREPALPRFDRSLFDGNGARDADGRRAGRRKGLRADPHPRHAGRGLSGQRSPEFEVSIPTMSVITTEHFDRFMEENRLEEVALSGESDDAIARAFQKGDLPVDSWAISAPCRNGIHAPLAVRSSSLLEDALERPFAGVYATKMIPNNELEPDARFRKLAEAVKLVWASTYFRGARAYRSHGGRRAPAGEDGGPPAGGRGAPARRSLLPGHLRRGALLRLLPLRLGPPRGRGRAPGARPREDDRGRRGVLDLLARPPARVGALRFDRRPPREPRRPSSGR